VEGIEKLAIQSATLETTIERLGNQIRTAVEGRPEILTAYLFGSVLNRENPGDIDVAVLIDEKTVHGETSIHDYVAELTSQMAKALENSDVDIVLLNRSSPIICMQVLRKGVKVFERQRRATDEFFVRTTGLYFDLKRIRRPIERQVLAGRIYG
jgi:predicted nucleotidyltransferase